MARSIPTLRKKRAARAARKSTTIRQSQRSSAKKPETSFKYRPLIPTTHEIRLVQILPLDRRRRMIDGVHPVRCTLHHVSLDDEPEYVALSYAWGDPQDTVPILVEECPFLVTRNLEAALRQFREDGGPGLLWVDALCINQKDDVEKTNQVQCMRTIFQEADYVIAWLGVPSDGTVDAVKFLKELGEEVCKFSVAASIPRADGPSAHSYIERFTAVFEPLRDLFERSYWWRVWVLQEIAVARNVRVHCGPWITDLEDFVAAASFDLLPGSAVGLLPRLRLGSSRTGLSIVTGTRLAFQRQAGVSLTYMLRRAASLRATDPRDKVFALLGLLKNSDQLGINVDYSLSYEEVYLETGKTLIKHYGLLPCLCYAIRPWPSRLMLPSWIPDWSIGVQPPRVGLIGIPPDALFCASGDTQSVVEFRGTAAQPILALSGARVDSIRSTRSVLAHWTQYEESRQLLSELEDYCRPQAKMYATPEQLMEAIWRTLIVDHVQSLKSGKIIRTTKAVRHGYKAPVASSQRPSLSDDKPCEHFGNWPPFMDKERLAITCQGYLAMCPDTAQCGDEICILFGSKVPFVLRKDEGGQYRLIGPAYVHGIMDGQLMERGVESMIFGLV